MRYKIALVGNMNNNNFSLLRYLLDEGLNVNLILMKNDISKSQKHFVVENDTWEIAKWQRQIVYKSYTDLELLLFRSKKYIRNEFSNYNFIICSGMIPMILNKANIKIDVFYPYSTGVEFIENYEDKSNSISKSFYKKIFYYLLKQLQKRALKKARYCISSETNFCKKTFDSLGIKMKVLSVPMVYCYNKPKESKISFYVQEVIRNIEKFELKVFSHTRHLKSKNNHILIKGFAQFINSKPKYKAALILFDYGIHVQDSKKLIKKCNIEKNVFWIKKISRKEILYLMNYIDLGATEFENVFFGGTAFEFASKGIPFFHHYDITEEKFLQTYKCKKPKYINVSSPSEIKYYIEKFFIDKSFFDETSKELKDWFDINLGIGLAKKWKNLIIDSFGKIDK